MFIAYRSIEINKIWLADLNFKLDAELSKVLIKNLAFKTYPEIWKNNLKINVDLKKKLFVVVELVMYTDDSLIGKKIYMYLKSVYEKLIFHNLITWPVFI